MIIVVEPTRRSLGTASQIKKLAQDINLERLWLVGNKIQTQDEIVFLETNSPGIPLLGTLPAVQGVLEADRLGVAVYDHVPELRTAAEEIAKKIDETIEEKTA